MKSYECIICEYKTNNITNYKQHCGTLKHRINETEKNYCNLCKKIYATRKKLMEHNNYKHKDLNIKLENKQERHIYNNIVNKHIQNNILNNALMDRVNSVEKNIKEEINKGNEVKE